ncbi:MAG: flagellar hook-basal body complex protein FliE [Proteobacteria bacterium]|nr:flagellar hook-basal body complex protein FliE [Pseudomonadota bacterium]
MEDIKISGKLSLNNQLLNKNQKTGDKSFQDRLKGAVKEVNTLHHIADQSIEKVIKGELGIHEGMIAIQEADTSLRLLAQVRSKVMAAYNEIMHMQF